MQHKLFDMIQEKMRGYNFEYFNRSGSGCTGVKVDDDKCYDYVILVTDIKELFLYAVFVPLDETNQSDDVDTIKDLYAHRRIKVDSE